MSGLLTFPISGRAVAEVIALFPMDLRWQIEDLETLADEPSVGLRTLLAGLQKAPVTVSSSELREAVKTADQVVSLVARMCGNEETSILVEDGDLFSIVVAAKGG